MSTTKGGGAWRSDPRWDGGSEETGSQADVRRPWMPLPGLEPKTEAGRSINNVQQDQSSRQKGVGVYYVAELLKANRWGGERKRSWHGAKGLGWSQFASLWHCAHTRLGECCSSLLDNRKIPGTPEQYLEKKLVLQCESVLSAYTLCFVFFYHCSCFHNTLCGLINGNTRLPVFMLLTRKLMCFLVFTENQMLICITHAGPRPFLVFRQHNRFYRYHKHKIPSNVKWNQNSCKAWHFYLLGLSYKVFFFFN